MSALPGRDDGHRRSRLTLRSFTPQPPIGGFGWPMAAAPPSLADDGVHVWSAHLGERTEPLSVLASTLSESERARVVRFRFARDQRRYVVGRSLLRLLLGRYLDAAPESLRFAIGARGKPALADRPCHGVHFNVAHADEVIVFAVTRIGPVGVDIERVHPMPDLELVAESSFSKRERAELATMLPASRSEGFFRCWTRKEAYVKATGDGLSYPLDRFDVSLSAGEAARILALDGDERAGGRWTLKELRPAVGFVGAIAVERPSISLRCFQLA